jgi:hypothetical protein
MGKNKFKCWIRNTGLNIAVMVGAKKSVQGFINGLGCGIHAEDRLLGGVAALQRGGGVADPDSSEKKNVK